MSPFSAQKSPSECKEELHFTFLLLWQHTGNACMGMHVCVCSILQGISKGTVKYEHSLMCSSSTIQGYK